MYASQTLCRTARAATIFGLVVTANGIPGLAQQWFGVAVQGGLISVSRTVTLPADETEFIVAATARVDVPQQAAIDALQGVGISAANLSALRVVENPGFQRWISGTTLAPDGALWVLQFNLMAPARRTAEIVQRLKALQKKPPEQLVEVRYLSRRSASEKSVADARARILPELIAEARRKAEQLALSADQTIAGSVEFVSDPALVGVGYALAGRLPNSFDPLDGATFLGNDTQAAFSVSLRFEKQ
jgi:hypothetical protein